LADGVEGATPDTVRGSAPSTTLRAVPSLARLRRACVDPRFASLTVEDFL